MALGLSTGGGGVNAKPYVSYDARAGRLFLVDRAQDSSGTWSSNKVDITNTAQFVIDLANIEVGYINYTDQGPIKVMAPLGNGLPARPDDKDTKGVFLFRQGFNVLLAMPSSLGGGIRELNSTAACAITGIDELHDKFTAAPESKAGKLPVVKITATVPITTAKSTNYKPVFDIVTWVDRPPALAVQNGETATYSVTPTEGVRAAPPATGSTQVKPPPAVAAPQAVPAGADDFG